MIIGVPKEIKNNEERVALTPSGVYTLVQNNHTVRIETSAGLGSGFTDKEYEEAGAVICKVDECWASEMVLKVKEPLETEYQYFREDLILFTYLHLAPNKPLTDALLQSNIFSIAYESVQLDNRTLPLLKPMSEVAGRMSTTIGTQFLKKNDGGRGILLSGVPGVERGKVLIIGGGIAGMNAAKIAIGLGARTTILDTNPERLVELDNLFGNDIQTMISNPYTIGEQIKQADLVIGAVLIPGHTAPKLVSEEMVKTMKPGSVIVDIAIDQGGIFETSEKVTTHEDPTYIKHGVVHYAVANMPGAVPRTSTLALTNCTLPYILSIADLGVLSAIKKNDALKKGVNTIKGKLTSQEVASDQGKQYVSVDELIG